MTDFKAKNIDSRERLIVALDLPSAQQAKDFVQTVGDEAVFYKVGLELFTAAGPAIVEWLRAEEKRVFVDLKLHDIPNTVRAAARSVALSVTPKNSTNLCELPPATMSTRFLPGSHLIGFASNGMVGHWKELEMRSAQSRCELIQNLRNSADSMWNATGKTRSKTTTCVMDSMNTDRPRNQAETSKSFTVAIHSDLRPAFRCLPGVAISCAQTHES